MTDRRLDAPDIRAWRDKWSKGRFEILAGPRRGFAENFRSLVCNSAIEADYYAFSDQDDLWEPDKLATGVGQMSSLGSSQAQMFCSSTLTIASNGQVIGRSPIFLRPPTFRNALVQSIAGANTMVFNRAARDLLALASTRSGFVSHDWWTYMILTGCGGTVHYTDRPLVRYRQHSANAVGQNNSFSARLDRFRRLFNGEFADWTSANLDGLSANRDLMTQDEGKRFDLFSRRGYRSRLRGCASSLLRASTARAVSGPPRCSWPRF